MSQSLIQFDSSRDTRPTCAVYHQSEDRKERTLNWSPCSSPPDLCGLITPFFFTVTPQYSSSPGSAQLALGMCFSVGCVGDWADRWMNGLMTVLSSMKSVQ